jgi:hypothetical protein
VQKYRFYKIGKTTYIFEYLNCDLVLAGIALAEAGWGSLCSSTLAKKDFRDLLLCAHDILQQLF